MGTIDKRILITSDNKSEFVIQSVFNEMKRRGYEVIICNNTIDDIRENGKDIKVYLISIDSAEFIKDTLIFIKDICFDTNKEIALYGDRLNIKEAARFIKVENVSMEFPRPTDSKQISNGLEELAKEAQERQEKKRILLIDDDPEFLRRTQEMIQNQYKTFMATSATAGMMVLAKHKVDLILVNYLLPVINGIQFAKSLQLEDKTKDIPLIFINSTPSSNVVSESKKVGAVNCIQKSKMENELVTALSDYFVEKDWKAKNLDSSYSIDDSIKMDIKSLWN